MTSRARPVRRSSRVRDVPAVVGCLAADAACIGAAMQEPCGRLDILLANAGDEGVIKLLIDMTVDELDQVKRARMRGFLLLTKRVVLLMVVHGACAIMQTSSVAVLAKPPYRVRKRTRL